MEQQPIKDLQYFKDEVAIEEGWRNWRDAAGRIHILEEAAERYASHREQQAKGAAFKEATSLQRAKCAEISGYTESAFPLIANPYREKGGGD